MRSTVPTVQADNEIRHITAHAAVVSSTAWAARFLSPAEPNFQKDFGVA